MIRFYDTFIGEYMIIPAPFRCYLLCTATVVILMPLSLKGQISPAERSGFTWITRESVPDKNYGNGYSIYSAAWPIFEKYPGPQDFQMGLAGCWLTTQRTGSEPSQFYTTIEGGLGWWHDTRFGTRLPKFIMGGVSYNFYAWANGPGAGRSNMLSNGQRDWSTPGGKYGVAQLSNHLLWAPDGLNMSQSLNGEFLGYGYTPLPLTDPLDFEAGVHARTGNQCWTLFLNATNFKGPATFFLPTFWTEPALSNPDLEGLFLDTRPSDPNIGFGIEHAVSPALISLDDKGTAYAKQLPLQYPQNIDDNSMVLNKISVYDHKMLWLDLRKWFEGGDPVLPSDIKQGALSVSFNNNGGSIAGEIKGNGLSHSISLDYIKNVQYNENVMGYTFDGQNIEYKDDMIKMPEYFMLDSDNKWKSISSIEVPFSTQLKETPVPLSVRPNNVPYLTPLDPECHWQEPNGPWQKPGPSAGPYYAHLGDGSTVTYYWYKFIDQPSIVHANLPQDMRERMQQRVEQLHRHWKHTDEYFENPEIGRLATLDPSSIVTPPAGLEIGYVPIVTRQAASPKKVRVFVLAGQSNMQGYGTIVDPEKDTGSLMDVIENDTLHEWVDIGTLDNWAVLEGAFLYYTQDMDTIKAQVTVGQGAHANAIGPELMFAHQLDKYYEDPILLIKTAWGGKNLAKDFRPPSAEGSTGPYYDKMIQTIKTVTQNLSREFPQLGSVEYEISGLVWFQGWNDGENDTYLNEYNSNLDFLIKDIRQDLNVAHLPIVIANSGQGGFVQSTDGWVRSMQEIVSVAQENVGCDDMMYGGRVGFVQTKPYYYDASISPQDAVHHFNNNALTFLQIGKDMGDEMIKAINDMAYCYTDCDNQTSPGIVSIGNRVWHDINNNGINEPEEPGIPGVSLVLWEDSDGDEIPDWQGFKGIRVTDEGGYYSFNGLPPGNYVVFVWSVDNWSSGQPLHGFQSSSVFVGDADNDIDLDNNGSGLPFTDIMSGIVRLELGDEPLLDGDPFSCYFDYDASGNNTVDFGFHNPSYPIAQFEIDSVSFCSPGEVQFRDISSNNPTTYQWVFSGGIPESSTEMHPKVVYPSPGEYDVVLTVTNDYGRHTVTKNKVVKILDNPTLNFNYSFSERTVSFSNLSTGEQLSYKWQFGDGNTSTEKDPMHTYAQEGEYTVLLTVFNPCGVFEFTRQVKIVSRPIALFTSDSTHVCLSSVVQFFNQSISVVDDLQWIFEGGEPMMSNEQNPIIHYPLAGSFDVSLIVSNGAGSDTMFLKDYILVMDTARAGFVFTIDTQTVYFVNQSTHSDLFLWQFGDGNISIEENPVYKYTQSGQYAVSLTSENDCGKDVYTENIIIDEISTTGPAPVSQISLYPNPNQGQFDVSIFSYLACDVDIILYNSSGQSVFVEEILCRPGQHKIPVYVPNPLAGVYVLFIKNKLFTKVYKIIITSL